LSRVDDNSDPLMTEFVGLFAGAPGLPLSAHGRDQHLDLDDISRGLRRWAFVDLGLPDSGDGDGADFCLLSVVLGKRRDAISL
jgi:hypothetical protein